MEVSVCAVHECSSSQSSIAARNSNPSLSRDSYIPEPRPITNSGRLGSSSGKEPHHNPANNLEVDNCVAGDTCVTAPEACCGDRSMKTKGWLHAKADSQISAYSKSGASDICAKCGMNIASECISALGHIYHPQCFKCHVSFFLTSSRWQHNTSYHPFFLMRRIIRTVTNPSTANSSQCKKETAQFLSASPTSFAD